MSKYQDLSKEELLKEVEKLQQELKSKKYGLVWDSEKEPEKVVVDCENNLPILERVKDKEVKTDESNDNILIEGDNYHALTVLNYTHKSKIDVIYIDPPYNTGNKDFIYNDRCVDKEDGYRHSKWLNFMEKRLRLAHHLLNEKGVIYISIGDDELAQLKILCDQIFKEENLLAIISRKSKATSNKGNFFSPSTDYILAYAKNYLYLDTFDDAQAQTSEKYIKLFKNEDERGKFNMVSLYMPSLDPRPNQRYYITCPDGSKAITPEEDKMFRWIPSTFEKNLKDDRVVFIKSKTSPLIDENGNQSKWNIYTKIYLHERQEGGMKPLTFLDMPNSAGSKELIKMGIDFSFSKPRPLIEHLIRITNKGKDIYVLDFFAGSGTTGHAVLNLNQEDGGNRKFIICTNNENDIAEKVTYNRISLAIKGYGTKKGEQVNGLGGNLQYFKTGLIDVERVDMVSDSQKQELTYKAGQIIAIKENTFEEVETNEWYQIFESKDKTRKTAIYFRENLDHFDSLIERIGKTKTVLYLYSYGRIKKETFQNIGKNIIIEDIPEPILEIYKEINLTLEK